MMSHMRTVVLIVPAPIAVIASEAPIIGRSWTRTIMRATHWSLLIFEDVTHSLSAAPQRPRRRQAATATINWYVRSSMPRTLTTVSRSVMFVSSIGEPLTYRGHTSTRGKK